MPKKHERYLMLMPFAQSQDLSLKLILGPQPRGLPAQQQLALLEPQQQDVLRLGRQQ
jgi:hypothetical protein